MNDWREALVQAAAHRARVRLADGRTGTLVYAPGTRSSVSSAQAPSVRHRNREMCGVRFDHFEATGKVVAVDPTEIVEVLRD